MTSPIPIVGPTKETYQIHREKKYTENLYCLSIPYNRMITLYYNQKWLSSCSAPHAISTLLIRWEITVCKTTGSRITMSSSSSSATPTRHIMGANEPATMNWGRCATRGY